MNEETAHSREPARADETTGADTAQAERAAGLQAEQDSAAAMNADVPQPSAAEPTDEDKTA